MNMMMHDNDDDGYHFNYCFKKIEEGLALNCRNTSEINFTFSSIRKKYGCVSEDFLVLKA